MDSVAMTGGRTRVLIVSNDVISSSMAGPGIRCWEFAKALAGEFAVTLAAPGEGDRFHPGISFATYDASGGASRDGEPTTLAALIDEAEVILISGSYLPVFPLLAAADKPLIVDLYVPFYLENLEASLVGPPEAKMAAHAWGLRVLGELLARGDFFLCASEKQKDLLLGMLILANRVNPSLYVEDRTVGNLIAVVPFALESRPPRQTKKVLKGIHPGIGADDKVVLWPSGAWQWLDPLTLLRALPLVATRIPEVKVFFMGMKHPNPAVVPESDMSAQTFALSRELGLTGERVFFNEWVPYDLRENYLLESDVGVALHFDCLETRFSFRVRVLDYIWAGLPMVITEGDHWSAVVAAEGLGRVVKPGDVPGVADALVAVLSERDLRSTIQPRFAALAKDLTWERASEPIAAFLRHPRRRAPWCPKAPLSTFAGTEVADLEERLRQQGAEIARLRDVVSGYEQGRVMRLMNAAQRVTRAMPGRRR